MIITYLHQYFNTPEMSGGTRSYEMARRLVKKGHTVNMVTSWRSSEFKRKRFLTIEAGINVYWLPVRYSNDMGFLRRIIAFLSFVIKASWTASKMDADLIFATSTPLTIALPAVYASRRRKIPMVFEVRDLWPEVPIALGVLKNPIVIKIAKWLEKFAYTNADRVVALAPGMRDGVCKRGYEKRKTAIIPNGADFGLFTYSNQPDWSKLEEKYTWIKEGKLIVYIGTVGLANNVDYVVKLAEAIEMYFPDNNIFFPIIGDGRELERVKEIAKEKKLINRKIFFIGSIPKNEVPVWLKYSSATIMTYDGPEILYRDSVSNKFFDSIAASRPVIANYKGFATLLAEKYDAGFILPKGDILTAASMVYIFLDNYESVLHAQSSAYKLAKTYFDRDKLSDDLNKIIYSLFSYNNEVEPMNIGKVFDELWNEVK